MRALNYDKLKNELANPYWKQNLSPLWLKFNGNNNAHQHRGNFMSIYAMFLAECETYSEGIKLLKVDEMFHICGRHSIPMKSSLIGMNARIQGVPAIAGRYQGFKDYLEMLGAWILQPRGFWRERKDEVLVYPYIRGEPKEEQATLLEIHKMLPRHLEGDFKSEICQDIFVALLSGEVTMANLPDHIGKYVKSARKAALPDHPLRTMSLDAPASERTTLSLRDVLDSRHGRQKTGHCCVTPIRGADRG